MINEELERFKNWLVAQGLRKLTINHYSRYVKELLKIGVSEENILQIIINHKSHNAVKAALKKYVVEFKELKDYDKRRVFSFKRTNQPEKKEGLNDHEWSLFIHGLKQRNDSKKYILIAKLLRETGYRISEIVGDDDPAKGLRPVRIKDGNRLFLKVKGGHWDPAYLSNELMSELKSYYQSIGLHNKSEELIFDVGRRQVWKVFHQASVLMKMRNVHPHLIKHTCSRDCDKLGLTATEKMKILHHKAIATTIGHYHNPELKDIWSKKVGYNVEKGPSSDEELNGFLERSLSAE